mmetsp:Transcript_5947/g.24569  ORF Transcript_5947/g.24569 Transcript_5947/m.24569 type:complete len:238 (+) Transcript_5947:1779-2492(+)
MRSGTFPPPPPPSPMGRAQVRSMTPRAKSMSDPGTALSLTMASPGYLTSTQLSAFAAIRLARETGTCAGCVGSSSGDIRISSRGSLFTGSGGSRRSLLCAREIPRRSSAASTAVSKPLCTYPFALRSATARSLRAVSSDFTAAASSGSFVLAARRYALAAFWSESDSALTRSAAAPAGSLKSSSSYSKATALTSAESWDLSAAWVAAARLLELAPAPCVPPSRSAPKMACRASVCAS